MFLFACMQFSQKTFAYYLSDEPPPGSNRICSTCAISKIVVKNATNNMIEHNTHNRHSKYQEENTTIQTKNTEKKARCVSAAVEIGGYLKLS